MMIADHLDNHPDIMKSRMADAIDRRGDMQSRVGARLLRGNDIDGALDVLNSVGWGWGNSNEQDENAQFHVYKAAQFARAAGGMKDRLREELELVHGGEEGVYDQIVVLTTRLRDEAMDKDGNLGAAALEACDHIENGVSLKNEQALDESNALNVLSACMSEFNRNKTILLSEARNALEQDNHEQARQYLNATKGIALTESGMEELNVIRYAVGWRELVACMNENPDKWEQQVKGAAEWAAKERTDNEYLLGDQLPQEVPEEEYRKRYEENLQAMLEHVKQFEEGGAIRKHLEEKDRNLGVEILETMQWMKENCADEWKNGCESLEALVRAWEDVTERAREEGQHLLGAASAALERDVEPLTEEERRNNTKTLALACIMERYDRPGCQDFTKGLTELSDADLRKDARRVMDDLKATSAEKTQGEIERICSDPQKARVVRAICETYEKARERPQGSGRG